MDTKKVLNFNSSWLEDGHKAAQHKQPCLNCIYRECNNPKFQASEFLELQNENRENFITDSFHSQCGINKVCQKGWLVLKDDMPSSYFDGHLSIGYIKYYTPALSSSEHVTNFNSTLNGYHRKNIIVIGVIMTSLFIAISCLKNWLNSLNCETFEGTILITVSFIGYLLGSTFSVCLLQKMQHRQLIIASLVSNIFNVFTNIYPATWFMAVVSFIMSFTMAFLWNSLSSYITFMSRNEVCSNKKHFSKASSHFFGLFFLIFHCHHIVSNLIINIPSLLGYFNALNNTTAWLILKENLTDIRNTLSSSLSANACGSNFNSESKAVGSEIVKETQSDYLLCTFYVTFLVLSIIITNFLLKPVSKCLCDSSNYPGPNLKLQIKSFGSFIVKREFLFLLPLLIYSLMQFGFFVAGATLAYIMCPMGFAMFSYTMICFGICASISSFISGTISTYVGRVSLFTIAISIFSLESVMSYTHVTVKVLKKGLVTALHHVKLNPAFIAKKHHNNESILLPGGLPIVCQLAVEIKMCHLAPLRMGGWQ